MTSFTTLSASESGKAPTSTIASRAPPDLRSSNWRRGHTAAITSMDTMQIVRRRDRIGQSRSNPMTRPRRLATMK
ncbi:hypothetical protein [Novosphingobium panipatense]|uniref:hypothetical protein n=1 Tax=Novosphingobium panipatense TaxID=428991 RepID=UPI00360DD1DE